MDMLVRIKVRRRSFYQVDEHLQLTRGLIENCLKRLVLQHAIPRRPGLVLVYPFAQVEMQAQAQVRMSACVVGSLARSGPAHHETGAGHDAVLMRLDNAAIDPGALAEVVR